MIAMGIASRRDVLRLSGVGAGGAAAALMLGQGVVHAAESVAESAGGSVAASAAGPDCGSSGGAGRLLGSWHVQVAFRSGPQAGRIEQTLLTFDSGGGIVESDGSGAWAHAGAWEQLTDRSYVYTLVEFAYDPATTHVTQVVVPRVYFTLADDGRTLASTSDQTHIYLYDPSTGARVTTVTLPNVARVTGVRIGTDYAPPASFSV